MTAAPSCRCGRDESGQIGGLESIVFGVLLFVFGTLAIASAWAVVDAKIATASAAREAGRSYVESNGTDADWASAHAAAEAAFVGSGRSGAALTLPRPSGPFVRCATLTVTASTRATLPRIPVIRAALRRLVVTSSHTEIVDPYRSGLGRSGVPCVP